MENPAQIFREINHVLQFLSELPIKNETVMIWNL